MLEFLTRLWFRVPTWAQLRVVAHQRAPWLIFTAVIGGVLCGSQFRRIPEPRLASGDYDVLNNESRRGKDMPVLVTFRNQTDAESVKANGHLDVADTQIEKIVIPDQLTLKTLCNSSDRSPFFEGTLDDIHRTGPARADLPEGAYLKPVTLRLSGKLVTCLEGRPRVLAEGLGVTIRILTPASPDKQPAIGKWVSRTAISSMDAAGDVFRKILLMIFVPLLAITFVRTPLEGRTLSNIRKLGAGILLANLVVAACGLLIGAGVAAGMRQHNLGAEEIKVQLGISDVTTAQVPYDAHPGISAITSLVPSNPLGSVGEASGNNAMHVLLLAGTIGLLLSFANDHIKSRAAELLKQGAAFLVRDQIYSSRSLMDFVQPLIPIGVFCLTASMTCTIQVSSVKAVMGGVLLSTLLSQVAVILVISAAAWWRHPGGLKEFRKVIRLAWPGIATAGATMSSFAALPELFTLPFIKNSDERRSTLNLGIALNKLGATAYLAAAAGFIALLSNNSPSFSRIVWILLFSVVTPIFAAGVPFAAVFALGLVLQYTTGLSGPAWWVMSIEPLLDPIVTVVNVIGNLFVSTCSAPHQTEEDVPCLKQHAAA